LGQHAEHAGHHKALNMVCVALLKRLPDALRHAVHPGLTGPVPSWQGQAVPVVIGTFQPGHVQVVHPTHEFAPAQHLPDEALDAGQIEPSIAPRALGRSHHLQRMEQFQIERA
jgi:hypothetical protein